MATTLRLPTLESLRSRISYAHALHPFTVEDTHNYLRFHLERAEVEAKLISDDAAKKIFHASQGDRAPSTSSPSKLSSPPPPRAATRSTAASCSR